MARWDHKRGSSPRKRGPINHCQWLWVPALAATMAWAELRTNLRLWEMAADAIPLFRIVINNGEFNSSV